MARSSTPRRYSSIGSTRVANIDQEVADQLVEIGIIHLIEDESRRYGTLDFRSVGERGGLRRKKSILADFGLRVTICIAAFSQREQCMVTVSDTMLSYDNAVPATDEATEKIFLLKGNWRMLFAGSVTPINGVLTQICAAQRPTSDFDNGPKELEHLEQICREAYQAERRQHVTDRFLSVYNMTLDDFRREGLQSFGVQEFAKINEQVRHFDLDLTILVCGFDRQGFPHIFEVGHPGETAEHDLLGYAAIGSGADMARGILTPRSVKRLPWR